MCAQEVIDMESRIIEAAKLVFVRKGYLATTMSDIANEVGIGRTAMHYYFRTKEMLFDAIFGQLMGNLLPNIGKIMDENTTMMEKLPQIIYGYVQALRKNPLFPVFVISEMNRDPEHLYHTVLKDPVQLLPVLRLRQQMEEEMEKGLLNKVPLIDVASTTIGLLVFPLLVRNPLSAVFLNGDTEKFDAYITNRIPLVVEILTNMLTPKNN